jgi:WD40 repeat protein
MSRQSDVASLFQPTLSLTLRGHHHGVRSVAFQPAATPSASTIPKIISGGMDGAVILWDTTGSARAVRFTGHRGPVLSVAQSCRPQMFASGGQDGYVRVWTPSERRTTITCSAFPEGRATNSLCEWRAHMGATRAVAFAKDSSDRLYTSGDDKAVKSWDLTTLASSSYRAKRMSNKFVGGFPVSPLTTHATSGHTSRVTALAVQSPCTSTSFFNYIASGGDDGVACVWDTRSRDAVHVIYGGSGGVTSLSFHPDGYVLATGHETGDVNLFDLRRSFSSSSSASPALSAVNMGASYSLLQHYHAAHMDVSGAGTRSVDFSPHGGWLLSCGDDGTTKMWDVKEGHLYCTVQAHDGPVASCRFSDDGSWFVTGGGIDRTVLIWRSGLAATSVSRALAPVDAASVTARSTLARASLPVCSSECHRGALAHPQTAARRTASASSAAMSTGSERTIESRRKAGLESPSRVSARSTSADIPATPSRRPPIPLAPQSVAPPMLSSSATTGVTGASQLQQRPFGSIPACDSAVSHDTDVSEDDLRERSFERCEQRYSHLVTPPPSSPNNAGAEADDAADDSERDNAAANGGPFRESDTSGNDASAQPQLLAKNFDADQVALEGRECAHHEEQRARIMEERVANLENAVAALVAYMQRQQTQQEERLAALQASSKKQAERSEAGMAELKRAMALLTAHVAPGFAAVESGVTRGPGEAQAAPDS